MTTLFKLISSTTADLHQSGFVKEANELQHLANLALDKTLSEDIRKDALKKIEMRCHVKWLGDFICLIYRKTIGGESLRNSADQLKSTFNPFNDSKGLGKFRISLTTIAIDKSTALIPHRANTSQFSQIYT